jgi:hypothetical protein
MKVYALTASTLLFVASSFVFAQPFDVSKPGAAAAYYMDQRLQEQKQRQQDNIQYQIDTARAAKEEKERLEAEQRQERVQRASIEYQVEMARAANEEKERLEAQLRLEESRRNQSIADSEVTRESFFNAYGLLQDELLLCEIRYDSDGFSSALSMFVGCVSPTFEKFYSSVNAPSFHFEQLKAQSIIVGAKIDAGELNMDEGNENLGLVIEASIGLLANSFIE